ncbi:MAG TPA: EAL domain-containing protein [Leptolyngbyaceae cyanobacterium]
MRLLKLAVSTFDESPSLPMPKSSDNLLYIESTLQELNLYNASIETDCSVAQVGKIFEKDQFLPGIILIKAGKFLGTISRRRFFEHMSRPYSLELFSNRPIHFLYQFISTQSLVFPCNTSIVQAAKQALQRSVEFLYDPIAIQMEKGVYQILDTHQLLLAQSYIQELTMFALEESQQALFQEKEKAQLTLQSVGDAVITTDAFGQIEFLNPVAEKLTGWRVEEAKGLPLTKVFKVIDDRTREPIKSIVETVLEERRIVGFSNHAVLIARNGNEFAIDDTVAPIRSKNGEIIGSILVFHDVTSERCLTRQLSWQATHDALTGLINRQEFEQKLEQSLQNAKTQQQQHTLCYLDLDRFKIINDTCGHLAGDELLRQVAALLQANVRMSDLLARLGGDEFGLLLYQCSIEQGMRVARTLRDAIQQFRFVWQDKTFTIGVSIGLTSIDEESQNITYVINAADAACYAAKNRGRNRIQIYQISDSELALSHGNIQWIPKITNAIEENRFRLYFQNIEPINSRCNNGIWEHYEVLLRMVDETGQLVSPGVFIPAAERYNLMPAIDRWVISTLFSSQKERYRKKWKFCQSLIERGINCDCLYAINLSGASINDDRFIDFLLDQFAIHDVPPQFICFEITETVAITNLTKAAQFISSLKAIGCRFALDDFGSGMSSFAYLKSLPVDYLKIDGSFVKDIVEDRVAGAMVEAINRIGQVMGIQTIAEFVENDAILEKIRALGVNYAQGYRIGKPSPFSGNSLLDGNSNDDYSCSLYASSG